VLRGLETARRSIDAVNFLPLLEHLDEQLPRGRSVGGFPLPNGVVGNEGFVVLGQHDFELRRDWALGGARIPIRREAPAQDGLGEGAEVRNERDIAVLGALRLQAGGKAKLAVGVTAIEDRPCPHESRGRNDEPGRTDEADPFEVCQDVRIELRHAPQFDSGQR